MAGRQPWWFRVVGKLLFETRMEAVCKADIELRSVQVLAYCAGGELKTGDENCAVTLGRLPGALIDRFGDKLKAGLLLRFKVGPAGFMVNSDGCISGADLQLVGTVTNHIRKADRYSRIVFQWQLRTEQVVSVQDLIAKVSEEGILAKE